MALSLYYLSMAGAPAGGVTRLVLLFLVLAVSHSDSLAAGLSTDPFVETVGQGCRGSGAAGTTRTYVTLQACKDECIADEGCYLVAYGGA